MSCILRKKRIFISQPMSGIPDEVVLDAREEIRKKVEKLLGREVELIDQFIKEDIPNSAGPLVYLGDSIMKMDQADIIVFADTNEYSFYTARGCLVELFAARVYGFEIIDLTKPLANLKDEFMFQDVIMTTNKKRYTTEILMAEGYEFNNKSKEEKKENG